MVARRKPGAHLGGLWEYPGGKITAGETATQAALRELWEECGISADALCVLAPVNHEYEDRCVSLTPVVCRWRAGEAQPHAATSCAWVEREELLRLEMPAANAEITRRVLDLGVER